MVKAGSIRGNLPQAPLPEEIVDVLLARPGLRIERIVSTGQVTRDGTWYDEDTDEWVLVVSGAARVKIEGEDAERRLGGGDWLLLPAHCRHRVTWTQSDPPTVWLAVHFAKET